MTIETRIAELTAEWEGAVDYGEIEQTHRAADYVLSEDDYEAAEIVALIEQQAENRKRAERIARRISAGMTVVNDYGLAYMMQSAPFGGVRTSGFGRINGREGLRACCNVKTVVTDRLPLHVGMSFYPVRAATFPLLSSVVSLIYSRGVRRRARAAVGLAQSLWSMARS
jgi:hypothetical protein